MSDGGRKQAPPGMGLSRRKFFKGMGTGLVSGAALGQGLIPGEGLAAVRPDQAAEDITRTTISLRVNGKPYSVEVEPRQTLLDVIRGELGHTGSKRVCDRGECGACTVQLDGRTVYACMMLAIDAHGAEITTVEGLAQNGKLHPIQEAFIRHDAYQCGFCTPGFEMSLKDLLEKNPHPTLDEIKHGLSGNVCRCGAYPHIFQVALELSGGKGGR